MVDQTIAGPLAFLDIAVLNPCFEDRMAGSRNLIAENFAHLKAINQRLDIRVKMAVFFRESAQVALKFWSKLDIYSLRLAHP